MIDIIVEEVIEESEPLELIPADTIKDINRKMSIKYLEKKLKLQATARNWKTINNK